MNVTHGVIMDLLPLYLAGEASEETRTLVEEYLRRHPELAADVRRSVERSGALLAAVSSAPPVQEIPATDFEIREKSTLARVRRFNRYRAQLLGFAIGFSVLPFSIVHTDTVRWWMLRDNPKQAVFFWIAALGCWIAHYLVGRRVTTMR
jgi:anti-sigma factor RsiW